MDRWDFYYRQKVLEDELDSAFNAGEVADQALATDLDFAARSPSATKADFGGIVWGLDVTDLGSGLQVSVDTGAAYDEDGRRVHVDSTMNLTLTKDGDTAIGQGGTPDGSLIDPGTGNERWLTLFLVFGRSLSDQRYDGYNNAVWFKREESFYFEVSAGPVQAIGGLNYTTHKPARQDGKVLLEDIRVVNATGTPDITEIDSTADNRRTEFYFDVTASSTPNKRIRWKTNMRDAVAELLNYYNDHVGGHADRHPSYDIDWVSGGRVWADGAPGTTNLATTVRDAIWGIIDDMAAKEPAGGGRPGTNNIGAKGTTGSSLQGPAYTSPFEIPGSETLQGVLETIKEALNGRVFRGGDSGINFLYPISAGINLGDPSGNKWDMYARDLYVDRNLISSLIPAVAQDNTHDIGTATARMRNIYLASYLKNDGFTELAGNLQVDGESAFNDKVAIEAQDGDHGLHLTFDGLAMNGGYLLRMDSKGGALGNFHRVDKMGGIAHTPRAEENFQYVGASPSATLSDHLPSHLWTATSGFSVPGYTLNGGSGKRSLRMTGTVSETGPRSVSIQHGGWWEAGQARSLAVLFGMGGVPAANMLFIGGFRGSFYGTYIYIRMDTNGAWGYFDNGTSIAYGAVNLIGGPPSGGTKYMFRIVVLSTAAVLVQGPGGIEALVPGSGAMNAGEYVNFEFQLYQVSGAYPGTAMDCYYMQVSEQDVADLG